MIVTVISIVITLCVIAAVFYICYKMFRVFYAKPVYLNEMKKIDGDLSKAQAMCHTAISAGKEPPKRFLDLFASACKQRKHVKRWFCEGVKDQDCKIIRSQVDKKIEALNHLKPGRSR